ncbi:hypothetical protein REG_0053 [Candidatus Regiella insecticola LSR1]|uniref:Uncharacterized protein n=1 Tax=Candidatus Regiella insecticola LSR1 TaxID=663321 RepID=E0WRU1_9ENTR|nr:hypothetical protein REG_0053 [Candidatus Regiella insecticola LSR1]
MLLTDTSLVELNNFALKFILARICEKTLPWNFFQSIDTASISTLLAFEFGRIAKEKLSIQRLISGNISPLRAYSKSLVLADTSSTTNSKCSFTLCKMCFFRSFFSQLIIAKEDCE